MPEIIVVRKTCCEGCLYSANPAANNAEVGKRLLADDTSILFYCHCNWRNGITGEAEGERVYCRGFYEAHKDRLPTPHFTKKKGKFWQWWLKIPEGTAHFNRG